ncbi:hypothetical protein [Acinetobacter baumannii]|uniref:hypothetical protein n=1 Tax=Acinetobacter baumannii TaxID=470 RepID=UPI0022EC72D2|nr:hypothetical protein [Acinetobacter baumannii]MDA5020277.1 hypothetical protein [Acinetobacter baumannii]HDQ4282027.1 hypothetical protein [Acinetobacter baumannii]
MRNELSNFKELIESSIFLENIGKENINKFNLNYTCISYDEINEIANSDKTINCDTEIMNNFRSLIYNDLGQNGLKEYNKFVVENRNEFFLIKDEVFSIFSRRSLSEDVALSFMEIYFNSILEDYFKEKYSINFYFFHDLLEFFNKGHVVCGYQFLTAKHRKLYNILSYAVDNFSLKNSLDKDKILVFVY